MTGQAIRLAIVFVVIAALAVLVLAMAASQPVAPRVADERPPPPSNKGDRLRIATAVRWEPFVVAQQPESSVAAPVAEPQETEPQEAEPRRHRHAHDICRGKGRTYTRGGRSWRCNR